MDMMQILRMLQQQTQQNQPLLPSEQNGRFDFGASPFPTAAPAAPQSNGLPPRNRSDLRTPAPAPAPAPQTPDLMGPHELVGPTRDLAGPMGMGVFEQQGPPITEAQRAEANLKGDLEKQFGINQDQPFYKDNDTMAMMLAQLSNGFGGMTLRGKNNMENLNTATFAQARKNKKQNKSMAYMIEHNPEMAAVMAQFPEEYRGEFMKAFIGGAYGDKSDTANIKNYKFYRDLSPEQRAMYDSVTSRDDTHVLPNGAIIRVDRGGRISTVLSGPDALAASSDKITSDASAGSQQTKFEGIHSAAEKATQKLPAMYEELEMIRDPARASGYFQPIERFLSELGSELGLSDGETATNAQILQSKAYSRVMNWFSTSGIGARGMDTPAEFARYLQLISGDPSNTQAAYERLMLDYIADQEKAIDTYNSALRDPQYGDVYRIGDTSVYSPFSYERRSPGSALPPGYNEDVR